MSRPTRADRLKRLSAPTDVTEHPHVSRQELTALRMTLGRLGRLLRQQNPEDLSYALMSLLFTIGRTQPVTAGDLAVAEGVSPPSVTRSLTRLVALGFVTRDPDPADRRAAVIRLTEKGERERDLILRSREIWLSEHLTRMSAEDIRIILAALPALGRLVEVGLLNEAEPQDLESPRAQ